MAQREALEGRGVESVRQWQGGQGGAAAGQQAIASMNELLVALPPSDAAPNETPAPAPEPQYTPGLLTQGVRGFSPDPLAPLSRTPWILSR